MCIRIPLLCFKRDVSTDTAFRFLQHLGDSVFRIFRFVRRTDDLILRFVDSSDVCATIVMDRQEDPSKGCDIQCSCAKDLYVLIGPSFGSFFWVPSRSLFEVLHVIHRTTLTLDRLLLCNTITRCSNINVHYARSV